MAFVTVGHEVAQRTCKELEGRPALTLVGITRRGVRRGGGGRGRGRRNDDWVRRHDGAAVAAGAVSVAGAGVAQTLGGGRHDVRRERVARVAAGTTAQPTVTVTVVCDTVGGAGGGGGGASELQLVCFDLRLELPFAFLLLIYPLLLELLLPLAQVGFLPIPL